MSDQLPARPLTTDLQPIETGPQRWLDAFPFPDADDHKHARGHLMCVTGGAARTGAARLAARAGLRVGAGLVTLLSPPDAVFVNAAQVTAVMVEGFEGSEELIEHARQANAVVIGPAAGISAATRDHVLALLRLGLPLLVDADGLTVFEGDPEGLYDELHDACVLTPHMGEFRRIFPGLLEETGEKVAAARAASERAGCTILVKGAETVIAAPDRAPVVNRHASPFLATAGSGDVLAGIIAGLMAQGMLPALAAEAGAWLHGEASLRRGPGLISEDLPELLPPILAALHAGRMAGG